MLQFLAGLAAGVAAGQKPAGERLQAAVTYGAVVAGIFEAGRIKRDPVVITADTLSQAVARQQLVQWHISNGYSLAKVDFVGEHGRIWTLTPN